MAANTRGRPHVAQISQNDGGPQAPPVPSAQSAKSAAGPSPKAGKPFTILFACVGNSARSQMAEGFARHIAATRGLNVVARSGGSKPLGYVLPEAIEVMRERGIDISGHVSQGFDEEWIRREVDLVVTMGCGDDACPAFVGKRMEDWDLEDPKGKGIEVFRWVRNDIEAKVDRLLST